MSHTTQLRLNQIYDEVQPNPPDNSQHQNHGKNTQQEHVGEQHDPLVCPTMGDQGRFVADPANICKYIKLNIVKAI